MNIGFLMKSNFFHRANEYRLEVKLNVSILFFFEKVNTNIRDANATEKNRFKKKTLKG